MALVVHIKFHFQLSWSPICTHKYRPNLLLLLLLVVVVVFFIYYGVFCTAPEDEHPPEAGDVSPRGRDSDVDADFQVCLLTHRMLESVSVSLSLIYMYSDENPHICLI